MGSYVLLLSVTTGYSMQSPPLFKADFTPPFSLSVIVEAYFAILSATTDASVFSFSFKLDSD